jgi:hypothetical protein
MGLFIPPCGFGYYTSNLTGTPPAALVGTNFTFGANSADGATVGVITTPTARDVHRVVISIGGCSTATNDNSALVDILRDPAGGTSYTNWIDNLVGGFTATPAAGTIPLSQHYDFPIFLRAGATLAVRARKNGATAATTGRIVVHLFGDPSRPEQWWCGQGIESLGIDEGTSKGTAHTPGNSGAFSAYATIGTSTRRYGNLALAINGSDGVMTAVGYYWQIGIGSAQAPGTPTFYHANSTGEVSARSSFLHSIPCDIPAGTALRVRGTASGTAEAHNVAFYGVY